MDIEQIRIRNLREDNDLTQAEVAKVIYKSQQGYAHIENGKARLSTDQLKQLCKYYNVSADYILGLTNKPHPLKERK